MPGKMIVVEGPDAVGKNTQTDMLVARLQKEGLTAVKYSFPRYESTTGQAIRRHLEKKTYLAQVEQWNATVTRAPEDAMVFQCTMAADRYVVADEIRAHLAAGTWVVLDRYWHSARIYGTLDGLDPKWIDALHSSLPTADMHIHLHLPLATARKRRPEIRDRYEENLEFRRQVAEAYELYWGLQVGLCPSRWSSVSSIGTKDEVHARVWDNIVHLVGQ